MAESAFKYCDLVMKGGITSGIVYPNAALKLSETYRFKSIGGTSAGAIAAAACAAAAVGERRKTAGQEIAKAPSQVGFAGLAGVSSTLSGEGFIFGLFQPASGASAAYRLVVVLAGNDGPLRKWLQTVVAVFAIAPVETFGLFALLCWGWWAAGFFSDPLAIVLHAVPSFLGAYALGAVFAALRVARVVRRNLLGLCCGKRGAGSFRGKGKPALTDWLHETLQNLSGQADARPLLFEDLWEAPPYPQEPQSSHAVSLTMITTDVSHSEPRSLPFDKDTHFWFLKREFDALFPENLVDWMIGESGKQRRFNGETYYRLPEYGKLPVLVATRMSLSFPLLISAVPLHEIFDPAAADGVDAPALKKSSPKTPLEATDSLAAGGAEQPSDTAAFRRCWFSDGGICSNFPIHLFDAPLPRWPTFAIDLVYPDANDRQNRGVFLPKPDDGWQAQYQSLSGMKSVREIAAFVFGIVATMQNWRDLLQSRAPGNRERIVHVPLTPEEGGMNLNMPARILEQVSEKGTRAGETFAEFSFDAHYWTRWRNLASALQRYTITVAESADYEPKIAEYVKAYETARTTNPVPPFAFEGAMQRAEARALLAGLIAQGHRWEDKGPDFTETAPRPLPQMQITLTY
ncbi:RpoH suppressor [Mesorhizobium sp. M3A.F.Ca.ET.174.01.1.1]|uniref:patatin-like phospholipase family protein n=1 Tax=unclassified Mesorhizobium TaxID=325217 RepID=UPI001093CBF1|nr:MULTISPECIES: patatin-like phospholipase family protein [unclassified Mesorhizobium]TGS86878.1 RpoH suppressor [Mesorhizobium sp. M3A.F.Ca.ET.175.01.1.1]TGT26709.1 RpoH suppressor [Mesorhizobium sp. M3A.F.Ca.ET.174.01.1.1]